MTPDKPVVTWGEFERAVALFLRLPPDPVDTSDLEEDS